MRPASPLLSASGCETTRRWLRSAAFAAKDFRTNQEPGRPILRRYVPAGPTVVVAADRGDAPAAARYNLSSLSRNYV
jgi:hypothetical protein